MRNINNCRKLKKAARRQAYVRLLAIILNLLLLSMSRISADCSNYWVGFEHPFHLYANGLLT
jgi:hypothetical protein